MAKNTDYANLTLVDPVTDATMPYSDVVNAEFGYSNSNMTKIDTLLKQNNDKLNDVITDTQINNLFS